MLVPVILILAYVPGHGPFDGDRLLVTDMLERGEDGRACRARGLVGLFDRDLGSDIGETRRSAVVRRSASFVLGAAD